MQGALTVLAGVLVFGAAGVAGAEDTLIAPSNEPLGISTQAALESSSMYLLQVWGPDTLGEMYVDVLRLEWDGALGNDLGNANVSVLGTLTTSQPEVHSTIEFVKESLGIEVMSAALGGWSDPGIAGLGSSEAMIANLLQTPAFTARRTNVPFVMQFYSIAVPAPGAVAIFAAGSVVCVRRKRPR